MTREGGALSVQRGDVVAGRYRAEEPLGPAWRARDESGGAEVVLVPVAMPTEDGADAGPNDSAAGAADDSAGHSSGSAADGSTSGRASGFPGSSPSGLAGGLAGTGVLDPSRWHERRGVLPVIGTATGDAGAWLVTEPIAARTLASAVDQWGALPNEQVLLIAAEALTALSGTGPHLAATAENILLTDDGHVVLLPIEATTDDLATLGTALHLAAEGHTPSATPQQPTLTPLITGLTREDPDRPTAIDRAFAELSRLGAPLEAVHGADTLHEAQAASAAAADDAAGDDPAGSDAVEAAAAIDPTPTDTKPADEDADATHVPGDVPTQPTSGAEILAETAETADNEAPADEDPDATHVPEADDADDSDTRTMSILRKRDAIPEVEDGEDEDGQDGGGDEGRGEDGEDGEDEDSGTESISLLPLSDATPDAEPTRQVPTISATDAIPDTITSADSEATHHSSPDSQPTHQAPTISAADAIPDTIIGADSEATHHSSPDSQPTHQAPTIPATDAIPDTITSADSEATHQVPTIPAADAIPDTITSADSQPPTPDTTATRPVPVLEAAAAEAAIVESTQEISSPDDSATKSLPIPAPATPTQPQPEPTQPQPAPANPFVAAAPVAPTQAADAIPVPPAQPSPPTQPSPSAQSAPPAQPIAPPQPMPSMAPPTQAADAVPPPGAPNPWLQQPQSQPQPQPQDTWQQPPQPAPAPAGGAWGPPPGQPFPPNQPPPGQPPFFPQQGPPPNKGNGGKTAAIIVGAVVAVAAVVSLVVFATRHTNSGSDTIGNAGKSSASGSSSSSATTASTPVPTSVPGTNFPTDSAASGSDTAGPSDSSSDTAGGDVTDTDSAGNTDSPPAITSTPFDPNSLNAMQTDKTPLELNALVPQDFTDDKGVHYTLKAGSVQPCVQTDMSANMQDILTSNSCSKEIAAAYVDDSGQYLVSVKVLPLPDQHTATTVYNDLAKQSTADFGIWCPESGAGSTACQGDYQSATIKQYREQQHRYIILTVALAVNHSQSTSIAPWLDAAAKKAVDSAGPSNWSGNQ